MKKLLTVALTVIMGAAFMYMPAVSFADEVEEQAADQPQQEEQLTEEPQEEQSLEQSQRDLIVEAAKSQVGFIKGDGEDPFTLQARDLGYSATQGWCGRFVWWCFYSTGIDRAYYNGMYTGSPQKMMEWAEENDLFIEKSEAQPGDILIKMYAADSPHAGIIECVDEDGTIHSIERNHYQCEDGVYSFTRPDTDYIIRPQYGE